MGVVETAMLFSVRFDALTFKYLMLIYRRVWGNSGMWDVRF